MKRTFTLTNLLLAAATSAVLAQGTKPEKEAPPDPPLIAAAPASAQWAITYAPKTPPKAPTDPDEIRNAKLRQLYSPTVLAKRVVKGGGQLAVYTAYEAGLKSEAWLIAGALFETPLREGESLHEVPRAKGDFPEIYWVKADNFRGTVDLKGRKVHLYDTESSEGNGGASKTTPHVKLPDGTYADDVSQAKVPPQRAYIDAESRLPITVDTGATVWNYQFGAAPSAMPIPDPRIQKLMKEAGPTAARSGS